MSPAVFSHGDLRLYLLSILADGPQHGYGLIQALSERTGGTYVPSAGTIYPRLAQLEEEGLVTKRAEGRRSIYEITDAGRDEVAKREEEIGPIEVNLNDSVRQIAEQVRSSVSEAMNALKAEFAAAKASARYSGAGAWPAQTQQPTGADEHTARADAPNAEFGWESRDTADARSRGVTSRANLMRAEAAIASFRAQARTMLRTRVAKGGTYTAEDVDRLEAGIKRVLDEL